jgi:hypothetical protein
LARCAYNVHFNLQVVREKVGRRSIIGENTANFRSRENNCIRAIPLDPLFCLQLAPQIDLTPRDSQDLTRLPL